MALVLVAVVVVVIALVRVVTDPLRVLVELFLLVVFLAAGWFALTRTGAKRVIAVVVAVAVVVARSRSWSAPRGMLVSVAVRLVALGVALSLAHYALGTTMGALAKGETPGTPVAAATRGVLFMNLKSGGGKAERFDLVDECKRRGIRPVVLEAGMDWLQTVRDVAASGVDVLGMAGGDGSQAMVGTVAAELGLPMVVVPAGTRNHLALDLGLDRDDVVGALDAYGEAVERTMDLADLNGHVFVNNVSLGLYAAIVRSPAYRDAKVGHDPVDAAAGSGTRHRALRPSLHRSGRCRASRRARDPDLQQPVRHDRGALVRAAPAWTPTSSASSPWCSASQGGAASFLAALATGHPERFEGFTSWSTSTFEVTSDAPIDIGLDGETMAMDPPLRFSIRPYPVRVRLPKHAIGYSPAARALGWKEGAHASCGRSYSATPPASTPEASSTASRSAGRLIGPLRSGPVVGSTTARRVRGGLVSDTQK